MQYPRFSFLLNIFCCMTRQIKLKNNLLNLSNQHAEMSSFGLDFLAQSQSLVNCYSFRYNPISTLSIIALRYWIPTEQLWISHELWLVVDSMFSTVLKPLPSKGKQPEDKHCLCALCTTKSELFSAAWTDSTDLATSLQLIGNLMASSDCNISHLTNWVCSANSAFLT